MVTHQCASNLQRKYVTATEACRAMLLCQRAQDDLSALIVTIHIAQGRSAPLLPFNGMRYIMRT